MVVSEVAGLEVVVVVVVVSEVVPLGLAAGAVVSVFCSQAASSAAPAKMQINLFIGVELSWQYQLMLNRSKHPFLAVAIYRR